MNEIVHILPGYAGAGIQPEAYQVVYELATQQALAGRRVALWMIGKGNEFAACPGNVPSVVFEKQSRRFGLHPGLIAWVNELQGKAIFHLHGGCIPAFYAIAKLLQQRNIPFVFTPHGVYTSTSRGQTVLLRSLYMRFYETSLLRAASAIHCFGQSEIDSLNLFYPNQKTVLVPCGVSGASGGLMNPDKHKFILGFSGPLDIQAKGLDLLVNAFAFVKQVHPGAVLWIIGDSVQRKQLDRQISLRGLQNDVVFWGNKIGDEKRLLLSQLNIYVQPSRKEALPAGVLEAAFMGIPCVVTEATNIGSLVRNFDCGEVVNDPDETILFNAIMNLYHRIKLDGRAAFSEKAKNMVAKEYDWGLLVLKFDRLYQVA